MHDDGGAPARPSTYRRLLPQLLFIALALGMPFGIATAPSIFRDGDVSWQVAAGQWILRHHAIPTTDPFSFSAYGRPWVAMEWLSQIILGGAFTAGGHAGLATIVAAALMTLFSILFFFLQRRSSPIVVAIALLMVAFVLAPFVLARPHVLAWPLLAGWTVLLLRASEAGKVPPLAATLLLVVWTNLHASFPLALLVEGAIGLDALLATQWKSLRQWLVFAAVSILALALNANGLAGLLQPFQTSTLAMLPFIGEWHASTTNATPFFFGVLILGIGASLSRGIRVPPGRLLLLLALLTMALLHVRHQSFFIIVAACILPPLFPSAEAPQPVSRLAVLGALPFLTLRWFVPLEPIEGPANPRHLLAAIPRELRSRPVFNEYTFGGPLILAGIRPYIDGRAEIYGDQFVADYVKISDGDLPALDAAVRKYGIEWAMLQRNQTVLIRNMERSGNWRRIYADSVGVIEARQSASPAQAGGAPKP